MLKRTNGIVLLILLVLTGLAGRVTNETLNSKERRFLITSLKESRADLLGTIKGLSDRQLDYRPAKGQPTIRECLNHIVAAEKAFSARAENALKQPAASGSLSHLSDEAITLQLAGACTAPQPAGASTPSRNSAEEALHHFKESRAHAIKYVRTTTENVRAYTSPVASYQADVYQLYLGMSAHQARHTRQIKEIMASPRFPKK